MTANQILRAMACGAALMAGAISGSALAQAYPAKTVRIIAPFGAGGGGDTTIRLQAQQLGAAMGVQFVVDNRPGANGVMRVHTAPTRGDRA